MELVACQACEKQISPMAVSCPNCGHPMRPQEPTLVVDELAAKLGIDSDKAASYTRRELKLQIITGKLVALSFFIGGCVALPLIYLRRTEKQALYEAAFADMPDIDWTPRESFLDYIPFVIAVAAIVLGGMGFLRLREASKMFKKEK